jgi:hypothetical protein
MAEDERIHPPPPVTPAPPITEADEDAVREFWKDIGRMMLRENVKKLDGLGRLVVGVAGLLVGLYAVALAMVGLRPDPPQDGEQLLYLLPLIFLLFTLLFAGGIFFVEKNDLTPRSWRGTRDAYMETARNKALFVRTALLMLALSVVAIIMAIWVYLG